MELPGRNNDRDGMFVQLTLGRFGACADAIIGTVDLLPLHHDVLEAFVISVEAVLQQLAERHRAATQGKQAECECVCHSCLLTR